MSKASDKRDDMLAALDTLTYIMPQGTGSFNEEVYCQLAKVSKVGARRYYNVFVACNGAIIDVTRLTARALGRRVTEGGIVIDGGNFDGGDEIVSHLSQKMRGTPGAFTYRRL